MSKAKIRWITTFALAVLCIFTLGLAISALSVGRTAKAAPAVYSPSTIFAKTGDADVGASVAEDKEDSYVQFKFTANEGDRVEYRRDLALKWFVADEENAQKYEAPAEGQLVNPGKAAHFSMTFAFGEIKFQSFDITFQSAEENVTKDGQTKNALHFAYADSVLTVAVRDAQFKEGDTDASANIHTIANATADLKFELIENEDVPGEFDVLLTEGDGDAASIGTFTNIGGYFMEYRSTSATSPQLPMLFEATMPENIAEGTEQTLLFKELNGQSFVLNDSGSVVDNAPAVLVINEKIYSFRLGQRFDLSYELIDVCDQYVSVTRQYYMLKYATAEEEEAEAAEETQNYLKPSKDDYSTLYLNKTFFMPTEEEVLEEVEIDGETFDRAYVSIRFLLDDGTDENDTYVYLTWYADPEADAVDTKGNEGVEAVVEYKCPVCGKVISEEEFNNAEAEATCTGEKTNPDYDETATEGDAAEKTLPCTAKILEYERQAVTNYFDYIVVDRKVEGPFFTGLTANKDTKTNDADWTQTVDPETGKDALGRYQEQVDEAAEKLSAGDGAYFYLPSLETLIGSNYADYRNLRFSIYYFKPNATDGSTASSATSLRYNNLRFEVDQVGLYTFRIIAQDAAGNTMKYFDKDRDLVTVTASNVFDIDGIPEFTFEIGYEGPSIEKPGSQTKGYNKQNYTISSFDIVALEGYNTEYTLYSFQAAEEGQKSYSADELIEIFDEITDLKKGNDLFNEDNKDKVAGGVKFSELAGRLEKEIQKYDPAVSEDDAKWDETDNAYEWDPESSLSFTPQEIGLYVVGIKVTDGTYPGLTSYAYKVIEITNESDVLYGSSNWIENNTTAIILFAISAALLIAIILLLVIKPNEKNLEEVDLSALKGAKKKTDKAPQKDEEKK